jgi:diketogulonate reductase-like aldo/keto reductase
MRARRFGPLEVEVPVIGIGTWNLESDDQKGAIAAIRRSLDVGATHVDTAEMYGSGRVEELVGRAIAGRRDEVFLVSKVLPKNASRAGVVRACERSLRRLATDRLDVYLLHWRGDEPLAETFAGFEDLRAAGKIRAWGVSNFDEHDLAEALAIAGPGRIACNQVCYHLRERTIEHAVIPWCETHDVAVVAYSPFGSGDFPAGVGHAEALAFLTRRPSVFAIPKTSHPARAAENAAAGDLVLDAATIARLDADFPLEEWRGLATI